MKNFSFNNGRQGHSSLLKWRFISLFCLFLLSSKLLCTAQGAEVQVNEEKQITLVAKNLTLSNVLNKIEKQSHYLFVINSSVNAKKQVTISAKQKTVREILSLLFQDSSVKYSIEGKYIVLTPQKEEPIKQKEISREKRTGVILDKQGEPLIGVNVKVKGTTLGVITDFDGKFTILAANQEELLFSYVGYVKKSCKVGSKKVFNITMHEDTKVLGEVVVTAMGIERKSSSLTYATQSVSGKDITKVKDVNFVNSLQGKSAGMTITPNAGGAGGASKILLRGNKSITGNNSPLIVVDGIPMTNNLANQRSLGDGGVLMESEPTNEGADPLSTMNPDDIEKITILKGANAAALYGSAASNGVIMITTKRGKKGKIRVDMSSSILFENPLLTPEIQNEYGARFNLENGRMSTDSWGKRLADLTKEELEFKNSIDNVQMRKQAKNDVSDFYKTATTLTHTLAVSGGNEIAQSYFSYGNSTANGMIERNSFRRHNLSFRQNFQLLNHRLKIDVSLGYLNQKTTNRPSSGTMQNPIYNLYTMPRNINLDYYRTNYVNNQGEWDSNGTHYLKQQFDQNGDPVLNANNQPVYSWTDESVKLQGPQQIWAYNSTSQNNPYWLVNMVTNENTMEIVNSYINTSFEIIKGLKAQGRLKYNRTIIKGESKVCATTQNSDQMVDRGTYSLRRNNLNEFYLDGMLSYNKDYPSFSLSASLGATTHVIKGVQSFMAGDATSYISGSGDFKYPTIIPKSVNIFQEFAGSGANRRNTETSDWDQGLFGTVALSYKEFINLDVSYREDWYRAFTQFKDIPHHYGYFSLGSNILLDKAFKMPSFLSDSKIRISYSEVGNSIPNLFYGRQQYNLLTGALQASPYSDFKQPRPEMTRSYEIGLETSFLDKALYVDFTFYNSEMHNNYLIANVAGKKKPINSGVIRNRGVEFSLGYNKAIVKELYWKSRVNYSYNKNTILETYEENGKEYLMSQLIGWGGKFMLKYQKGGSYGDLYATDFSYDKNGKIRLNSKGAPVLDQQNQYAKYVGNMNANHHLSWSNNLSYKGFNMYVLLDGQIGGKVISFTEAYLDRAGVSKRVANARNYAKENNLYWTSPQGDRFPALYMSDGQLAPIEAYYKAVGGDINATQYVYDATNFRLRELSLGYTFYDLFGQSKNLSLSFIARNLCFLYKKAPVDPETSMSTQNGLGNIDIFNLPTMRSYGVSISVSF